MNLIKFRSRTGLIGTVVFIWMFSLLVPKSLGETEVTDHDVYGQRSELVLDSHGLHVRVSTDVNHAKKTLENNLSDSPPEVIWSYSDSYSIPESVSLTEDATKVWVGQMLNLGRTQLFSTVDNGTPLWECPFSGADPFVAASEDASIVAALVNKGGICTIYKWTSSSSIPDWEYTFPYGYWAYGKSIAVSKDGTTIVAAGSFSSKGKILAVIFDSTSNVPIWTFTHSDDNPGIRGVDISDDGSIILVASCIGIYVLERDNQNVRWTGSTYATDGHSLSGDGSVVVNGCYDLKVYQWNGSTYEFLWTYDIPGLWIFGACDVSSDGSTVAVGVNKHGYYLEKKVLMFNTSNSTPLWEYSTSGSGEYQDGVYDVALSNDGSKCIIGAWGDQYHTHPEVVIFKRNSPIPIFSMKTPGSVFSVDISSDGQYATVGCKAVHANVLEMGGVVYSISIEQTCLLEQIYGKYSEETELLRNFRDNVLSQTPEGQEVIRLYYRWSPVIVKAMEEDEKFEEWVKEMIDGVLMLIEEKAE